MLKILLTAVTICCLSYTMAMAQQYSISGRVADAGEKLPLPGASIRLIRLTDSLSVGKASDSNGHFVFANLQPAVYALKITFIGYTPVEQKIILANQSHDAGVIVLSPELTQLKEVEIIEKVPPVTQNGDTTQYNSRAFKTNPDASAADLIRKMPGIEITDGTVKAQGEDVSRVLVDGKPFFGDDPNAALNNLPAEIIDQIQVYDQRSDQAQFTGFDDGQTSKTINIVTRPDRRNGQFGKVYAGYGADNKYQAGANLNIFNNDKRISIVAQSNNINIQNFSSQDLVGISGSSGQGGRGGGSGRTGGGRSGGGGQGGRRGGQGGSSDVSNFMVGQQNGISTTHAAGINYSDQWGKKTDVTGSYFFNMNDNTANQSVFREYVLPSDSGQTYQENNLSLSRNYNHRLNFRMDHKIDQSNSLLIRPTLSMQQNNGLSTLLGQTDSDNGLLNQTQNRFATDLVGLNFSNSILYRHRFTKPMRTFSFDLATGYNQYNGTSNLQAENTFYTEIENASTVNQSSDLLKNGWNISGNASYTEPISKRSVLQFNSVTSYQLNDSRKNTFDYADAAEEYTLLNPALSNTFTSRYVSQRIGTSYRYQAAKMNFSFGTSYQWAQMQNEQVLPLTYTFSRTFNNVLPNAMFRYRFSRTKNLNVMYRTSTDQPSVEQMQNVINNTNPIQLSVGNPSLSQAYQHSFTTRYSATNTTKNSTFFVLLGGNYVNNYITNSTFIAQKDSLLNGEILLARGSQLIKPMNLDGYWTIRSFATYGLPFSLIKSNINFNLSANYTRRPGLVNNQLNYANSQALGLGMVISSNISEKIDFTVSSQSTFNFTENTLQSDLNTRYFTQNSRLNLTWQFWKGLVYETSLNHRVNSGLSAGFDQSYLYWNMSVGKKFLKNNQGEIRLTVNDLLKQNNSIQRNITESYIEDTRTDVLQRFFMLTFTYNIRNFKKKDNNG